MKPNSVPIDQAGRIVLPKNMRQELGIKSGDTFKVSIHGTALTLTPNKSGGGFVRRGKALVFATASDENLTNEMVQAVLESGRSDRAIESVLGLAGRGRE